MESRKLLVPLALLSLYLIWGATFLGMKFAIESFPPLMMAALRFVLAGGLLYLGLRWHGVPNPTWRQWGGATIVGTLLLGVGNGGVAVAQQWIASGIAAMVIGTVPLWAVVFSALWGQPPRKRELVGIALGTLGVILLNLHGGLEASPAGAALLIAGAIAWAFGSIWGKHLPMPQGAMAGAAQMLTAGGMLWLASWGMGERMAAPPTPKALWSLAYLVLLGSLFAFSAYIYLLRTVRPALATSYAFVNPVVAVMLGALLADEHLSTEDLLALGVILASVLLVLPFSRRDQASS